MAWRDWVWGKREEAKAAPAPFQPEILITPCHKLAARGDNLEPGANGEAFGKARELELQLIALIQEREARHQRLVNKGPEPVIVPIDNAPTPRNPARTPPPATDEPVLLPLRKSLPVTWSADENELLGKLTRAYTDAAIPAMVQKHDRLAQLPDARKLAEDVYTLAKSAITTSLWGPSR